MHAGSSARRAPPVAGAATRGNAVQEARSVQCREQGSERGPGMFEGVEPMGRGRAKAKQVKVARQLKYSGGGTDLDRLRTELGVGEEEQEAERQAAYADFGDRYSVDDEDS